MFWEAGPHCDIDFFSEVDEEMGEQFHSSVSIADLQVIEGVMVCDWNLVDVAWLRGQTRVVEVHQHVT